MTAVLEKNESANALKKLLADGPLTISAYNYGGFEKVCSLGRELPRNNGGNVFPGSVPMIAFCSELKKYGILI